MAKKLKRLWRKVFGWKPMPREGDLWRRQGNDIKILEVCSEAVLYVYVFEGREIEWGRDQFHSCRMHVVGIKALHERWKLDAISAEVNHEDEL
jgi:hypothetical protein